jgi:hypothetical protein
MSRLTNPSRGSCSPVAEAEQNRTPAASRQIFLRPMRDRYYLWAWTRVGNGVSRCSITAEAALRLDRLKLGEIEFDNRPQGIGERAVLLIVRQCVQLRGLRLHGRGDGVVPALDPAASVGNRNVFNRWRAVLSMPLQTRGYLLKLLQMAVLRFGAPDCPGSP